MCGLEGYPVKRVFSNWPKTVLVDNMNVNTINSDVYYNVKLLVKGLIKTTNNHFYYTKYKIVKQDTIFFIQYLYVKN